MRFRSSEKKRTWPARGSESLSGASTKLEDLLLAHLMVWLVSEKDFAGKSRWKSRLRRGFSDGDTVDRKALGDGKGDRNETQSLKGFPELIHG